MCEGLGVYVLSAKYGESIVVTLPDGRWFLVDAFGDESVGVSHCSPVYSFLSRLGLHSDACEFVLTSHLHHDHCSGLPRLLKLLPDLRLVAHSAYQVNADCDVIFRTLIRREQAELKQEGAMMAAMRALYEETPPQFYFTLGTTLATGTDAAGNMYFVHVIAPTNRGAVRLLRLFTNNYGRVSSTASNETINNTSIAILVKYGQTNVILTADLEHAGWIDLLANRRVSAHQNHS